MIKQKQTNLIWTST